eukprot:3942069-Pyramimonas_sp.AAC.1
MELLVRVELAERASLSTREAPRGSMTRAPMMQLPPAACGAARPPGARQRQPGACPSRSPRSPAPTLSLAPRGCPRGPGLLSAVEVGPSLLLHVVPALGRL